MKESGSGPGRYLDDVPFGTDHLWIVVTLALVGLIEAYATGMTGVLVVVGQKFLNMSATDVPWLVVAPTFTLILGGLACGVYFQDRFSRRSILLVGVIWSCLFTLLTAFSGSTLQLIAMRVISGFGYGLALPSAYPIGAELMPPKNRSTVGWTYEASLGTGFTLVFLAATLLAHTANGWRFIPLPALILLVVLPILIVKKIPESPRWLATRGHPQAALAVVNRFRTRAGLTAVAALPDVSATDRAVLPFSSLFKPGQFSRLMLAISVYTCATVPFYVFSTLLPAILVKQGFAEVASFAFTIVLFAVTIPGKILNGWLMERLGRQVTIAGALFTSLVALGIGVLAPSATSFIIMEVLLGISVLSSYPAIRVYMTEQFPTSNRGRGYFFSEMVGRFIAGVLVSFVLAYQLGSPGVIYAVVAAFAVVGALSPLLFGKKDTRGSLERAAADL